MSGLRPFFITGANAKIKVNGKTLAFCTDLSYSIEVLHQTPKVLGMYEGSSVEPLGYTVSGTFTVIRYAKDAKSAVGGTSPSGIAANDAGNGIGNWGSAWDSTSLGDTLLNTVGLGKPNDGKANENLNPAKLSTGSTFDIQIYQKAASGAPKAPKDDGIAAAISTVGSFISNPVSSILGQAGSSDSGSTGNYVGVANIRNCRITRADFSISKKNVATQRFSFTALYVDEDAFVADFSGNGQQFSS